MLRERDARRGRRAGGLPRRLADRGRFVPERAKASTWILTLVHRRAVDLVRREERRRTEPLDAGVEARGRRVRRRRRLAAARAASECRARCSRYPTRSARRWSSPTTAASRSRSSPNGWASRSVRSRAGCSPASRACVSCWATSESEEERWSAEAMHELTRRVRAGRARLRTSRVEFEEHLRHCERCQAELADLQRGRGSLAYASRCSRRTAGAARDGCSSWLGRSARTSFRCAAEAQPDELGARRGGVDGGGRGDRCSGSGRRSLSSDLGGGAGGT